MATDEGMAVRFYEVGSARDLADRLIEILRSSELERSMAQQNFATGVEMSMSTVINNYLRWFRLNKAKTALSREWMIVDQKWRGVQTGRKSPAGSALVPMVSGRIAIAGDLYGAFDLKSDHACQVDDPVEQSSAHQA